MENRTNLLIARDGLELGISLAYGPRINLLRYQGGPNLMVQMPGPVSFEQWAVYGGHRVWAAPEHPLRSYWPDNQPPVVQQDDQFQLSAWNNDASGLCRKMCIELLPGGTCLVWNKITNLGKGRQELASWGITSLIPGGLGLMPFGHAGDTGLNPDRHLVFWPYTPNMHPALAAHGSVLTLDQRKLGTKFKLGSWQVQGWLAYLIGNWLFIKHSPVVPGATYPDLNCNLEIYGDADMLELETLAPLRNLEPEESTEHTEQWWLRAVEPQRNENQCLEKALEIIESVLIP